MTEQLRGVTAAIWDFDGTMIDSYGVFSQVVTEVAEIANLSTPTEQAIKHNFHGSLEDSIKGVLNLVDDDHVKQVTADFLRLQADYYKNPDEHVFDDAVRLAAHLANLGVEQVVVTNREHRGRGTASPRHIVQHSRLQPYFATFVCGEDAAVRKPDPAVIAGVQQLRQRPANQLLVIGDQFVDAQLALNLGTKAVLVNRFTEAIPHIHALGETTDVRVVSSLDELIER